MIAVFIRDLSEPADSPPIFASCDRELVRAITRIVTRRLSADGPPPRLRGVPRETKDKTDTE